MAPLTAAEIQAHPEYPHINWKLVPEQKDTLSIASGRGGPFNISYEVHGHGPRKILWLMGLGGMKSTWQRQTKDFAHTDADIYTSLLFDNRGIGESDKPVMRYSTSEMAKDAVELLEHLGWTEERSVHVVGISMGGMIAQELAMLIPERIASLNLVSTAPRLVRTLGYFENLRNRINLFVPRSLDEQIAKVKADCYSAAWLEKPDEMESTVQPFPTNGDRFAAGEIFKRMSPNAFTKPGFMCQAVAAGWHHKSPEQLKQLGDRVGRDRILVIHGTIDRMIDFVHAEMMLRELGGEEAGVTKAFYEGMGHVMPIEKRKEFKELIAKRIDITEKMGKA